MKKPLSILFAALAALLCTAYGGQTGVSSPDGTLCLEVAERGGRIGYTVTRRGAPLLDFSTLGFELLDAPALREGLEITGTSRDSRDETWETVWGEQRTVRSHYNELRVSVRESDAPRRRFDVVFRLFDDGYGFRFEFPEQPHLGEFAITDELTEYRFPSDHNAWWMPAREPYYESLARHTPISRMDTVNTPLTLECAGGGYLALHEADLTDYAKMSLYPDGTTLRCHLTPWSTGVKVYARTPFRTPWRTMIVADTPGGLVTSRLMLNLNEPCKLEDTSWIHPTKYMGVWWEMIVGKSSWAYSNASAVNLDSIDYKTMKPNGIHGANNDNVKRYIDFAAENGFDQLLVEGWNIGWEDWFGHEKDYVFDFVTPNPDFDIAMLNDYAHSKGIKLMMHHETSGSLRNYERHLDAAYSLMNKYGYDAVKSGYVGNMVPRGEYHYGQWANNHYLYCVKEAAKHKIMVNAHEATRPTGLCRTYPNLVGNESARGTEYQQSAGIMPHHVTILPFTRLQGGPMDYTPGIFCMDVSKLNPENHGHVNATLCNQLALYVTLYSPLQMAADVPENYMRYADAFRFIKDVAVDWDESRYLAAEPGEYIIAARREKGGQRWFVGGVTNEDARTMTVDFSFLTKGQKYMATIYADAKDADYETNPEKYVISRRVVTAKDKEKIFMARGGGFAISLMPVDDHTQKLKKRK